MQSTVDRLKKFRQSADRRARVFDIGNAVKAIGNLGGRTKTVNLDKSNDEELKAKFEKLASQHKELKNSQGNR